MEDVTNPVSLPFFYYVQEFPFFLTLYLLTPYSRVLLEKLTGFAANQEIPPHFIEP